MPPWPTALSLSPEDIETLKRWVAAGSPWKEAPQSELSVRFISTIDRGDLALVRSMLRDHSLANTSDANGASALMHAALNANLETVKLLLRSGADPRARNHAGATALMWAVDDPMKISVRLNAGSDVNARSNHGTTALLAASAIWGNSGVGSQLIARGADVNAVDTDGATPLVKASSVGDIQMVRLLLARGANTEQIAGNFSPLTAAAWYGHLDIVRLLLESGARINTIDGGFHIAPLPAATLFDRRQIVKLLLDRGGDVNQETKAIWAMTPGTPLMLAAYTETAKSDLVELLLSHGAKVGAVTPDGQTALGRARQKGDTEVVRALLEAGDKEPAKVEAAIPARMADEPPAIRTLVERSLALLQRGDAHFLEQTGCKSCHNQALPAMAYGMARERGFRFDEQAAKRQSDDVLQIMVAQREKVLQLMEDDGPPSSGAYALAGLAAMGYPGDATTAAFVRNTAVKQLPAGNWHVLSARPPLEYSPVSATAITIRALSLYAKSSRLSDYGGRIRQAKEWLQHYEPQYSEERNMRLLGLAWAKAEPAVIRSAVRHVLAQQREDGGWSQLATLPSDAYATGQALYALNQAGGMPATAAEYQRGVGFLRRTQLEDGSWRVRSRALAIQPPLESGFPHGRDQFISASGTSWAAMALMLTEPVHR
jgi:ankyrin repeat protein